MQKPHAEYADTTPWHCGLLGPVSADVIYISDAASTVCLILD
ncbi:MAG: hypothetical protein ACI30W_04040 [Muribaculaceae bacterium]